MVSTNVPIDVEESDLPRTSSQFLRRPSITGFLRRSKSAEIRPKRKPQVLIRKVDVERQKKQQAKTAIWQHLPAPPLPHPLLLPSLQVFEPTSLGEDGRFDFSTSQIHPLMINEEVSNRMTDFTHNAVSVSSFDSFDRSPCSDNMSFQRRYSYASSATSCFSNPHRVRKRKNPVPFNILIIGAQSCGKTSFLNFLKTSLALPAKKRAPRPTDLREDIFAPPYPKVGSFEKHYIETNVDGERIGLTLWDSEGLKKTIIDFQLQETVMFLEKKFEETFNEEMKVIRTPGGVLDTHIHAIFLLLDPLRLDQNIGAFKSATFQESWSNGKHDYSSLGVVGGLDEDLDIKVFRTLQGMTTIIPIISKADTITTAHMNFLKRNIRESLRQANLDPLETFRVEESDNEFSDSSTFDLKEYETGFDDSNNSGRMSANLTRISMNRNRCINNSEISTENSAFPLSTISPDIYEPGIIGRQFPWGLADPMNPEHCDFVRLKNLIFGECLNDLREICWEVCYENWRTRRLKLFQAR